MLNAFLTWFQKMPEEYCEHYTSAVNQLKSRPRDQKIIQDQEEEAEFCRSMGLNRKAMRKTHLYVEDILRRLVDCGYFVGEKSKLANVRHDLLKKKRTNGKDIDHIRLMKLGFLNFQHEIEPSFLSQNNPKTVYNCRGELPVLFQFHSGERRRTKQKC